MKAFKAFTFIILGVFGIILGFFLVLIVGMSIFTTVSMSLANFRGLGIEFIFGSMFVMTVCGAVMYYIYKSPSLIKTGLKSFKQWMNSDNENGNS